MRSSEWSCAFGVLSKMFGGTELVVAVCSDCGNLGSVGCRAGARSSCWLAAGNQSGWCHLDCWWHCVGGCCVRLLVCWALAVGSFPVVKLLGGRGVVGWCRQVGWRRRAGSCCVAIALYLGFGWAQTWSSSCLAAGCNWMVSLELVGGTSGSCRDR